jgi:hypothetical protein
MKKRYVRNNKSGALGRSQPPPDNLWVSYDPEAIRQALYEFAGTITEVEGEARIKAIYEARGAGTRPTTCPYDVPA